MASISSRPTLSQSSFSQTSKISSSFEREFHILVSAGYLLYQRGGRMIFRIADYSDTAAYFLDYLTLRHGVDSIIGSLCMNVRPQCHYQFFDRRFVKYRYSINEPQ